MLPKKLCQILFLIGCLSLVACGRGRSGPSGKILLVSNDETAGHGLVEYDVVTGGRQTIFAAPDFTQVHQVVADSETEIVLTYTPPPTVDTGFFDRSGLYDLNLAREPVEPVPILEGELSQEFYLQHAGSGDGRWLFFTHFEPKFTGGITEFAMTVKRLDRSSREILTIASDGNWPTVAPDSQRIAYVLIDPATQERALVTADLNGTDVMTLVPFGRFFDVDLPMYSPDGDWIYFTVAEEQQVRSFWDVILGVRVAEAHSNLPSLWWRVATGGGEPEMVSGDRIVITAGSFSPDGAYIAYASDSGLHIMTAEGVEEGSVRPVQGVGDLVWLAE